MLGSNILSDIIANFFPSKRSWKRVPLKNILYQIIEDTVVVTALLSAIWLVGRIEAVFYPVGGLVFFRNTPFPLRADYFLDAADVGNLSCFSLRSVYFLVRGRVR